MVGFIGANGLHEAPRDVRDAAAFVFSEERAFDERTDEPMLICQILRRELIPRWEGAL